MDKRGAGLITAFLFKDNGMLMTTSKKHCYCAGCILSFHIIVPHREFKEQNNYFSRQTREEGSKGELKKLGLAEETVIMKNLLACIWLNITRGQFCNWMIEDGGDNYMLVGLHWLSGLVFLWLILRWSPLTGRISAFCQWRAKFNPKRQP